MSIDWITVSAQIVNFLILVWLLKRFLYKPIIRAMEQREKRIAEQLNDAEMREQQATLAVEQFHEKKKVLELQSDEILAEAHRRAAQHKKQLQDEARAEVAEAREHWHRQLLQEKNEFLDDLRGQMASTLQKIARNALKDLADSELEKQMIHLLLNQLSSLDPKFRQQLLHAAENLSEPVRVVSTFALDASVRRHITLMIHTHLSDNVAVEYEESPALLCGIVLTIGEQQLGWNVADYLQQLSEQFEQTLVTSIPLTLSASNNAALSNDQKIKG